LHSSPSIKKVIKEDEMGGAHSTHGSGKKCIHETLKVRHLLEDLGVDGRITLNWIVKK
jgi:hypothetical protein